MPPASAVNNNSNAALQAAAKAEREEKLRGALKIFIIKERQRKKEEYEAKEREAQLRREREARERENDMTLEETRGQIAKLDEKLTDLQNQKQQLFLQLKKVLNEDETRKKQQKDNELFAMQQALQVSNNVPTAQVFMPAVRVQHHQMPLLQKAGNPPVKRGRSPSPPQAYYKTGGTPAYNSTKHDDGRRSADYRVLWNKPPNQYQSPGTLFYQTTTNVTSATQTMADARLQPLYPPFNLPLRGYHLELQPQPAVSVSKTDTTSSKQQQQQQQATQVFHINLDQPILTQQQADLVGVTAVSGAGAGGVPTAGKPQVTMEKLNERYHIEVKHDTPTGHVLSLPHVPDGVIYKPLIGELPLQQSVLQITSNLPQNPKSTGSITQGYPPGRGGPAHETQITRQQLTVLPAQNAQQQQQPPSSSASSASVSASSSASSSAAASQQLHYTRRLF